MNAIWAGLLFGGPLWFWFISRKDIRAEENRIKEIAEIPLKKEIESIEREHRREMFHKSERVSGLEKELRFAQAEIERLQKRDAFLSKKEKDVSGDSSILDTNDDFWRGAD
jgi:predicted RNase H-like nuclease (RuvC/YqgF family)